MAGREALVGEPDALSDESPAELMETRLVLEVAVARLAARRAPHDPAGLDELRVNVEALERAAAPESYPDDLDREFHATVARLTGNGLLTALLEPMWAAMGQELFTTLAQRAGRPARPHVPPSSTAPSTRPFVPVTRSSPASRWSATCGR